MYVLVTDDEARTLGRILETSGRRISEYITDLLMQLATELTLQHREQSDQPVGASG